MTKCSEIFIAQYLECEIEKLQNCGKRKRKYFGVTTINHYRVNKKSEKNFHNDDHGCWREMMEEPLM